jgi:hypothetical protein
MIPGKTQVSSVKTKDLRPGMFSFKNRCLVIAIVGSTLGLQYYEVTKYYSDRGIIDIRIYTASMPHHIDFLKED